jgi:hypothetical protein
VIEGISLAPRSSSSLPLSCVATMSIRLCSHTSHSGNTFRCAPSANRRCCRRRYSVNE